MTAWTREPRASAWRHATHSVRTVLVRDGHARTAVRACWTCRVILREWAACGSSETASGRPCLRPSAGLGTTPGLCVEHRAVHQTRQLARRSTRRAVS